MSMEIQGGNMGRTTISVTDELADELYQRKERGESYEDVLWWMVKETGGAERETVEEQHTRTREDPEAPEPEATEAVPEDRSLEDLVDDVGDNVLPGSGTKLEDRRDALHAAVSYLREQGTATPTDFQNNVYPNHTGHYTEGSNPPRSWWKNCIYKGMAELAERTDKIESADTTGEWRYLGGDGGGPETGEMYDPTEEF